MNNFIKLHSGNIWIRSGLSFCFSLALLIGAEPLRAASFGEPSLFDYYLPGDHVLNRRYNEFVEKIESQFMEIENLDLLIEAVNRADFNVYSNKDESIRASLAQVLVVVELIKQKQQRAENQCGLSQPIALAVGGVFGNTVGFMNLLISLASGSGVEIEESELESFAETVVALSPDPVTGSAQVAVHFHRRFCVVPLAQFEYGQQLVNELGLGQLYLNYAQQNNFRLDR